MTMGHSGTAMIDSRGGSLVGGMQMTLWRCDGGLDKMLLDEG